MQRPPRGPANPAPQLQAAIDRRLLRLTLTAAGLATAVLAVVVAVVEARVALEQANGTAQVVERELLEQLAAGLPLSQLQRKLQITAAAHQLSLAVVVNPQGRIIAAADGAQLGEPFRRSQLEPVSNAVWDELWPCLPASRSWWQHPRCQPPLSRRAGSRLISLARTPLSLQGSAGMETGGREEGGLLITSLDLGPGLQRAARNGGLIVLAGLMLLLASGGGLVLLVRGQLMRELVQLASTDPATGLLNRPAFLEQMVGWLAQARARGTPVVLAIGGLDHFKQLNARHGYKAGDQVLEVLSGTLERALEPGEWAARLAGDQFGLALQGGGEQAERLRALAAQIAAQPLEVEPGHWARLTITIGMACSNGPAGYQINTLLTQADRNMREGKQLGGNQVVNQ